MPGKVKDGEQDTKPSKKRNRKVASCNPCRTRRIRCDRGKPCAACLVRNDEAGCVWDANALAPLYERREANETERLREEVDRLQRLVDVLVSARPPPEFGHLPPLPPPPYPVSNDEDKTRPVGPVIASAAMGSPAQVRQEQQQQPSEEPQALEAEDLVRRLSELTIKTFQLGGEEAQDPHGDSLVKEAQHLLDLSVPIPDSPPCGSTSIPDLLSLFPTTSTPQDTLELVGRLPPKNLLNKAVEGYYSAISWYIHPITRKQYQAHEDLVYAAKEANEPAPANSLAIVFSVCALGLFGGEANGPAYSGYATTDLAVKLIELARSALAIGRFLESPILDAVRALVLVATHYAVLAPGDNGGCGMGLLALAVNACLQLELHRDPDKRPGKLSFAEAEDRRRLFWNVFLKDVEISSVMGRRWTLLHVRDCNTKFPQDIDDDQLEHEAPVPTGKETGMTALLVRMKFAKLTEQITEEVFGIQPVTYTRVLQLDSEIRKLEKDLPAMYQVGASSDPLIASKALIVTLALLQELMRLHRPFLARSYFDEKFSFSRTACVNTARRVLELQRSPLLRASWACMCYKSINASTILCIDLMYEPGNPQASESKRLIESCIERLERFKAISTICRRGAALLRFLLDKIDAASRSFRPAEDQAPVLKRSRTAPSRTLPSVTASPQPFDPPHAEPELAHKLPKASSFSSGLSAGTSGSGRPTYPYPSSRPKTGSSSTSSRFASLDFRSDASTSGETSKGGGFSSALSSLPSSTFLPSIVSMRSSADEIAAMDFPALLGIDGNAAPFSFDFGSTSTPASSAPSASSVMPKVEVCSEAGGSPLMDRTEGGLDNLLHDDGRWASFASVDSIPASAGANSSLFSTGPPSVKMDEAFTFDAGAETFGGSRGDEGREGGQAPTALWESPLAQQQQRPVGRWADSEWAEWLRGI